MEYGIVKYLFYMRSGVSTKEQQESMINDNGRIAAAASLTDIYSKIYRETIDRSVHHEATMPLSVRSLLYLPTPELLESRALMDDCVAARCFQYSFYAPEKNTKLTMADCWPQRLPQTSNPTRAMQQSIDLLDTEPPCHYQYGPYTICQQERRTTWTGAENGADIYQIRQSTWLERVRAISPTRGKKGEGSSRL
jgi:hypothetical protein